MAAQMVAFKASRHLAHISIIGAPTARGVLERDGDSRRRREILKYRLVGAGLGKSKQIWASLSKSTTKFRQVDDNGKS